MCLSVCYCVLVSLQQRAAAGRDSSHSPLPILPKGHHSTSFGDRSSRCLQRASHFQPPISDFFLPLLLFGTARRSQGGRGPGRNLYSVHRSTSSARPPRSSWLRLSGLAEGRHQSVLAGWGHPARYRPEHQAGDRLMPLLFGLVRPGWRGQKAHRPRRGRYDRLSNLILVSRSPAPSHGYQFQCLSRRAAARLPLPAARAVAREAATTVATRLLSAVCQQRQMPLDPSAR